MSLAASRQVLRHSRFAVRRVAVRNASTTSEAAGAAKDKASEATSKASEGLSRAQSSAGSALNKAGSMGSAALNRLGALGGRTGQAVAFVQSLIPPTIYYSRVGLELGKIVFQQRGMSLPSQQTFLTHMQPLINALKNPASAFSQSANAASTTSPTNVLSRVRNMSQAQMLSAGVVAAEVIGFFSVGEIIGRMKITGYRSSAQAHH